MPTPVFVCGAECGIAVVGTVSTPGVEHWSAVNGTAPTVVTSRPGPAMRSTRAFRFNPTAATSYLTHTFATSIASPATTVWRFYIYFTTLPSADTWLFSDNTLAGVYFKQSDSKIYAVSGGGGVLGATGVAVTTGTEYRIDCKTVLNTTTTSDVQVDGVACGQASLSTSATSDPNIRVGNQSAVTADFYIDDIVVSGTSGDYPIGAGTVAGLYPVSDGTHQGAWATGTFGKSTSGATNAASTDTDLWTSLDNPLVSTAAGAWVSDLTGTVTTNNVTFVLGNLPANASTVNGAMFVFTLHAATTTASNHTFHLADTSASLGTTMYTGAFNVSTITIPIFVSNVDRSGTLFTPTSVNDVQVRFSSTDSNPDVYLDGVCMEVDYVAVAAIPNKILQVSQAVQRAAVR